MPSAITVPWSITTIWSASRSASSRYCVVSSTVVPAATRPSIVSHRPSRLRGSRPGRRLVEEQHRRAEHERRGEVEPAAHAARVGLRGPPGGLAELEALEQLVARARAPPRAACGRAGRPSRGSRPGQVLVDRGVLTREPDLARRRRRRARRRARDARAARVGPEQRGEDPDRGGLAGTVGPEQPEHATGRCREVDAAERAHRAVGLRQPLHDYCVIRHMRAASEGCSFHGTGGHTP